MIVLLHWNEAEAKELAAKLGRDVTPVWTAGPLAIKAVDALKPEAVVVSFDRVPSSGKGMAVTLRERKATRGIPLVFVAGDASKMEGAVKLLPDVVTTDWAKVSKAVAKAIKTQPAQPVVYKSSIENPAASLGQKLGVKEGFRVALLGAVPEGFEVQIGGVCERKLRGEQDLIILFVRDRGEFVQMLGTMLSKLPEKVRLWIAYPKQSAKTGSDLTQADVRATAIENGLVDYKVASFDATWTGMLFAWKREKATPAP